MSDMLITQVADLDSGEVFTWEGNRYKVSHHTLDGCEAVCIALSKGGEVTFNPYTWVKVKIRRPS